MAQRDDDVVVVDVKTGRESASHVVQVMIYMYAVPRAPERYRNLKMRGQVAYRDHTVRVPQSQRTSGSSRTWAKPSAGWRTKHPPVE